MTDVHRRVGRHATVEELVELVPRIAREEDGVVRSVSRRSTSSSSTKPDIARGSASRPRCASGSAFTTTASTSTSPPIGPATSEREAVFAELLRLLSLDRG